MANFYLHNADGAFLKCCFSLYHEIFILVNLTYINFSWNTLFLLFYEQIGYIIGGIFLIYESYFGKMFSELILVNDRLPKTEQITKREWFTMYNQKLKNKLAAIENQVEKKIHITNTVNNNKNKHKVVPTSPNESMDENNALKNWGGEKEKEKEEGEGEGS